MNPLITGRTLHLLKKFISMLENDGERKQLEETLQDRSLIVTAFLQKSGQSFTSDGNAGVENSQSMPLDANLMQGTPYRLFCFKSTTR